MAAVKMPNVDPAKLGVVVLLLADLAAVYPIMMTFNESPESQIFAPTPAPGIKLAPQTDTAVAVANTEPPAPEVLEWNPFRAVRGFQTADMVDQEAAPAGQVSSILPIPTDNIKLHGIVNLNNRYYALVSVEGAPSMEVSQGATLRGTDIRVKTITRDMIVLSQPNWLDTKLRLERSTPAWSPWYQAPETGALRGGIRLRGARPSQDTVAREGGRVSARDTGPVPGGPLAESGE